MVRSRVFLSSTEWMTIRTSELGWIDFVYLKETFFMKGLSKEQLLLEIVHTNYVEFSMRKWKKISFF